MGDHDTHHAAVALLRAGAVTADCGLRFEPIALASGRLALAGDPVDPAQVCPECQRIQPPSVQWGLSVLDLQSHAVEEGDDHPAGSYIYVTLCGHHLLAALTDLSARRRTPCERCLAQLAGHHSE